MRHGSPSLGAVLPVILVLLVPALAAPRARGATGAPRNVLLVIVDNMRPALGAYNNSEVKTPHMDALAATSTLFARAFCQFAWCAPSRNSFLVGRRPNDTKAYNFVNDFRQQLPDAVTLPEYFKRHGYYATSIGKVFHPNLPPNFDFPLSWSDMPVDPHKPPCPNGTMTCAYTAGDEMDADARTTDVALQRLAAWRASGAGFRKGEKVARKGGGDTRKGARPLFMAVGYQSPRLPWSYPGSVAARYPPASAITPATHLASPALGSGENLDWFRPTEVDMYSDVRNITHASPMPTAQQRDARRAYYAAISHVDDQVGRLLAAFHAAGLDNDTAVVLMADHGQNLGEQNMWSMMNDRETSLRVPLLVRRAPSDRRPQVAEYWHPVELVDVYPTVVALAGLPPLPASWRMPGTDLTPGLATGAVLKPVNAAFGQITRCHNCTQAYPGALASQCRWDATPDRPFAVPCCLTPRTDFQFMGVSVRTASWRYTTFCAWDGASLRIDAARCHRSELFDHRNDTTLYNVDDFEVTNLAGSPAYSAVQASLHDMVTAAFV